MADFTDAYGLWIDCGELLASNSWQLFTRPTQQGALFRLTFKLDWAAWDNRMGWRSFGRFRFSHHDDSGAFNLVEPSFPIYPKREQMLIRCPILPEFYTDTYNIRLASYRKYRKFKPPPSVKAITGQISYDRDKSKIPDIPWSLKVEYLIDEAFKLSGETLQLNSQIQEQLNRIEEKL